MTVTVRHVGVLRVVGDAVDAALRDNLSGPKLLRHSWLLRCTWICYGNRLVAAMFRRGYPYPPRHPMFCKWPRRRVNDPIDETVLDGLRQLQSKARPDFASRIIGLYLDGTPGVLSELRTAALAGDMPLLRPSIHNLLSASAALGAVRLAALCHDMDLVLRTGSVPDAAERVEAIAGEYQRVEVALRIWCVANASGA